MEHASRPREHIFFSGRELQLYISNATVLVVYKCSNNTSYFQHIYFCNVVQSFT